MPRPINIVVLMMKTYEDVTSFDDNIKKLLKLVKADKDAQER